MSKLINILVLCPNNSARSILGEALFNHYGAGRVKAWSAGSNPSGSVNDVRGPVWPGHPTAVHWGIPDPTQVEPPEARREAFEETYQALEKRILAFLTLPLETLTPEKSAMAARRIHTGA